MAIQQIRPTPVVPLDIFELIIETLSASSDFSTIRSLCLTNTSLVHFCRKQIFGRLTIKPKQWDDRPIKRFMPVYFAKQTIASYIREFRFWVDMHDHRSLNAVSALLTSRHLKNVQTFSLAFTEDLSLSPVRKEMTALPDEFISSLCKFIVANPIKRLELWQINDIPVTLFTYLPRLRELFLYNVGLADTPMPKSLRKRPTYIPRLRQLHLKRNIGGALMGMLGRKESVVDISCLEDLSVYVEDEYGKIPIRPLFSIPERLRKIKVGGELLSLIFSFGCLISSPGSSPRLECIKRFGDSLNNRTLQSLAALEFSVVLTVWGQDPFVNIMEELSAISGRNCLENLIITLTIDWDIRCSVVPEVWGRLESVLVSEGSFPVLRRVELDITITQYDSQDYKQFKSQLENIGRKQFSKLGQIIDLKFGVELAFVKQVEE